MNQDHELNQGTTGKANRSVKSKKEKKMASLEQVEGSASHSSEKAAFDVKKSVQEAKSNLQTGFSDIYQHSENFLSELEPVIKEYVQTATQYVRRNPIKTFAGVVVVGYLASRIMKWGRK